MAVTDRSACDAVMGAGKSGERDASISRLQELFKSPAAVEDKKAEQGCNIERVWPGSGRRLACLALDAEEQQNDNEIDKLIIHSEFSKFRPLLLEAVFSDLIRRI